MSSSSPTAAEVAAKAGVSRMTVYRVINSDPKVSTRTATAVQRVMRSLNFVPSRQRHARLPGVDESLPQLGTGRFAFLIPDTNVAALRTPLTGRLLHGIDAVLAPRGLDLSLTRLPSEGHLPDLITQQKVDGVIVRSNLMDDYPVEPLQSLPCVWLMESREQAPSGDIVHTDDAAIGRIAAQALLERGCRDVAIVNETAAHDSYAARIRSFMSTMRGSEVEVHRIEANGEPIDHLVGLIKKHLKNHTKTDGYFLPGTMPIINRLYQALMNSGRDLKQVVVVTASYDSDVTDSIRPKPIHIESLPEQLGEAAAELLLWRLNHPTAAGRRISLSPRTVESS
ncbi:MAG: LacI family DNA-binding transcriptional regulator [Planctomycetota bacterium]